MRTRKAGPIRKRYGLTLMIAMACPCCGVLNSCQENTFQSMPKPARNDAYGTLMEAQRIAVQQESDALCSFIARSGWPMQETPTGLWYYIYRTTAPIPPSPIGQGDIVKVEYRLQLLNGEVIASYLGEKMKTIVVGHSDIEAGLTEALLLLHPGDCAKVLIPSYLGYGFSGDGIRVPSGASLLYDLHIVDVQRHAERKIL